MMIGRLAPAPDQLDRDIAAVLGRDHGRLFRALAGPGGGAARKLAVAGALALTASLSALVVMNRMPADAPAPGMASVDRPSLGPAPADPVPPALQPRLAKAGEQAPASDPMIDGPRGQAAVVLPEIAARPPIEVAVGPVASARIERQPRGRAEPLQVASARAASRPAPGPIKSLSTGSGVSGASDTLFEPEGGAASALSSEPGEQIELVSVDVQTRASPFELRPQALILDSAAGGAQARKKIRDIESLDAIRSLRRQ